MLWKKGETNGIKSDKGQTSVSVSSRFYSTDREESEGEARERERRSEWERKAQAAGQQRERRGAEGEVHTAAVTRRSSAAPPFPGIPLLSHR